MNLNELFQNEEEKQMKYQLRKEIEKLISNGRIFQMKSNEILRELLLTFNNNDDGKIGKASEIVMRYILTPTTKRTGITKNYVWYGDCKKFNPITNKYIKLEIKTSCGELDNVDTVDYVLYCPTIDLNIILEQQFFVIPKDDFLKLMSGNTYSGKGQVLRIKSSSHGTVVKSFQSFFAPTRPKASKKLADYIWDFCYDYPVLEQKIDW